MSEKCRQELTAAEKPELWQRQQPGILKAIRRAFGKRYAGVASTGSAPPFTSIPDRLRDPHIVLRPEPELPPNS